MELSNGTRVKLNAEGLRQEPRRQGVTGTVQKTSQGTLRVLWDGRKTAEVYDESLLQPAGETTVVQPQRTTTGERNREIRRQRKFMHGALMKIRHNPAHKDFESRCVKVLGGSEEATPELIAEAEQINGMALADFTPMYV